MNQESDCLYRFFDKEEFALQFAESGKLRMSDFSKSPYLAGKLGDGLEGTEFRTHGDITIRNNIAKGDVDMFNNFYDIGVPFMKFNPSVHIESMFLSNNRLSIKKLPVAYYTSYSLKLWNRSFCRKMDRNYAVRIKRLPEYFDIKHNVCGEYIGKNFDCDGKTIQGPIVYDNRESSPFDKAGSWKIFFRKEKQFEPELEYRFIAIPKYRPDNCDFIDITMNDAIPMLEMVSKSEIDSL